MDGRLGVRLTSKLAAEGAISRNDVNLPAGAFVANVGSVRLDYALSPRMTLRTLTQYNSSTDQWSTSARFNFIYRPGSDIFVSYDDVRRDMPGLYDFADKQLIVKVTYLLSR
jgi:GH18 family chitinase